MKGGFCMETVFGTWIPWLLWIQGGCLVLFLLLLLFTNSYTKKKLEEMEQQDVLHNPINSK
jgi:hypothetical protein